jgi:hypothetical protein
MKIPYMNDEEQIQLHVITIINHHDTNTLYEEGSQREPSELHTNI